MNLRLLGFAFLIGSFAALPPLRTLRADEPFGRLACSYRHLSRFRAEEDLGKGPRHADYVWDLPDIRRRLLRDVMKGNRRREHLRQRPMLRHLCANGRMVGLPLAAFQRG